MKNPSLRADGGLGNLRITPTSPQLKVVLVGDDYALKVSIRKNKGGAFSDPALRNHSYVTETTNSDHPCGNFMPSHIVSRSFRIYPLLDKKNLRTTIYGICKSRP